MLKKISHRKTLTGLSYVELTGCSAVFLLTLAAMLFALAASQQRAAAVEGRSNISAYAVTPTVGISLPTSIDFADVLPTPSGVTTTATADLTVTTTDSAGYSLYLYSSDGDNSLRPKISSLANISTINATAGDVGLTLSSLEPNTWGYNLGTEAPTDSTTYSAVPTDNSTPIQTKDISDTNSASDTYILSFGAKVDTTTASGAYSDTLTIAVVAEPRSLTLSEITNMQEMTSEICAASAENETKQLIDIRDGKLYWVAKLADDNCWMTQNLDLDLSTSKALTPDDSDVSRSWTPTRSTTTSIFSNTTNTEQYSWDPGYWVKSDPDGYGNYCGSSSGIASFNDADCTSAGWTNVSSMAPMDDGATDTVISGNTYNAHYLVGNFYQWNAATAGTGGTITSTNATDSICPKGWQLPTSNNSNSGSFQALMSAYSITSNADSTTRITQSPLYFHPSGYVDSGSLWSAGNNGSYWSSTAKSSTSSAYYLSFNSGYVYPSNSYNRYYGRSVRCLAR